MLKAKVSWRERHLPSIIEVPSIIGKDNAVSWLQDNYGGMVESISFEDGETPPTYPK